MYVDANLTRTSETVDHRLWKTVGITIRIRIPTCQHVQIHQNAGFRWFNSNALVGGHFEVCLPALQGGRETQWLLGQFATLQAGVLPVWCLEFLGQRLWRWLWPDELVHFGYESHELQKTSDQNLFFCFVRGQSFSVRVGMKPGPHFLCDIG